MIAQAQKTVLINRSAASVCEFVLNGANNRLWKPSVLDARPLGQAPYGAGSKFHQELRGPEGPIPADYEITEYKANELIEIQVVAGPVRWRGRYEFRLQPAGTELTYTLAYEPVEYDSALTQEILEDMQRVLQEEQAAWARLSPQEQHSLLLLSNGKAEPDIARSMFVGEGTVRNYVFSGLAKLMTPRIQRWMDDEVSTLDDLKTFLEKIA